jgi:hypothetical protein
MKTLLWLLRLVIFVALMPVIAIIVALIFIVNVDWWFSSQQRQEAIDVFRKLWSWGTRTYLTEKIAGCRHGSAHSGQRYSRDSIFITVASLNRRYEP